MKRTAKKTPTRKATPPRRQPSARPPQVRPPYWGTMGSPGNPWHPLRAAG